MPELINAIRAAWKGNPLPSLDLNKEERRAEPERFLSSGENELTTVTQLDDVLICRYLGPSAGRARQFFILAWGLLRPMMLNRLPCPSRFWNT
jgi:urease accessory protein